MCVQDKVLDLYVFGQYEDYKEVFAIINITFNEKYLLKKMTERLKELTQEQQEEVLSELNKVKKEWKMRRRRSGRRFKNMQITNFILNFGNK